MRSGRRPVRPGHDKGVAHHTHWGGRPVRPGQENTTDHQHPTTPAVRRRIQQHTNKTSGASSRLQHHEPGWRTTRAREAGPSVLARKTPQTTNTRHCRPYGGGYNSTPTKLAEHPAGYNTTNRGGAPHALGRPARPSRPGKHHRQPTPDHAGRTAADTTAHQQNKPSIQPATTPRTETRTRQHSTPHQRGGAHKSTAHPNRGGGARINTAPTLATHTPQATDNRQRQPYGGGDNSEPTKQAEHPAGCNTTNPNRTRRHSTPHQGSATHKHGTPQQGGGTRTSTAPTPAKPTTQPQPQPTPRATTTQTKHHHRGRRAPTQHARARGGTCTNTARPTMRGATIQHSMPHQGARHAPPQHQPRPSKHHRQPTPDNAGCTAAETTANQQNQPGIQPATTPRTDIRTRRHSTPHQGGGHAQTRHQPRPSQQHNRDHNPPNSWRQPKPNSTTAEGGHQHSTPQQGGATHQHSTPNQWGGPRTSTARPNRGGGTHQHSTNPGQSNTTDNQHPTTPALRRR